MKLIRRLAYFSGGFGMGIIILMFILSGKETSCDYGIQARALKNIRLKKRDFSENSLMFFENNRIDTAIVNTMLHQGKIVFSESEPRLEPCGKYVIQKKQKNEKILKIRITNCDSLATVMDAYFEE